LLLAPAISEAASGLFLPDDEDLKNLLLSFDVFDVAEVVTTASTVAVAEQPGSRHSFRLIICLLSCTFLVAEVLPSVAITEGVASEVTAVPQLPPQQQWPQPLNIQLQLLPRLFLQLWPFSKLLLFLEDQKGFPDQLQQQYNRQQHRHHHL